jgi:hypothetical protein
MALVIIGTGTASATYAWYELNQDKEITVSGTSFGKAAGLDLGFVSDVDLDHEGLTYSATDSAKEGKKIYWCDDPTEISSDLVKYVLSANGYAYNEMFPVTSGKYAKGDNFTLYDAPAHECTFAQIHTLADKAMYAGLHLAFKVSGGSNTTSSQTVEGASLYLTDFAIAGSAKESIRAFISSSTVSSILKPVASAAGSTSVGGPLDLDRDGCFDYVREADGNDYEVYYGQFEKDPVYGAAYSETVSTGPNYDCFANPNHVKGVYPLKDASAYSSTAAYESMASYAFQGEGGDNSGITALGKTDANGIALADISIYMEGWDRSLIDNKIGSTIGATIGFAVGSV